MTQPTLFPMVRHSRCAKCGSVAPLAEFYPHEFTLEDDDDYEANRAMRFDMQCPNCGENLDPQSETFAFAEEVRVGPFVGKGLE